MIKRKLKDLEARIEAEITKLLSSGAKVPHTNQGWDLITSVIHDSVKASGLIPSTVCVTSPFFTKPQITQQLTLDLPE